jgi:hypothetical protein
MVTTKKKSAPKKKVVKKPTKKPVKKKAAKKKKAVKKKEEKPIGRPPEIPTELMTTGQLGQIEKLSQLGYNNLELAAALGICEKTFYNWIEKDSILVTVIERGRKLANAKVKESLLKRAIGYYAAETAVERLPHTVDATGNKVKGKVIRIQQKTKHIEGSVKAQLHWLKVYNREEFGDIVLESSDNTFDEKMKKVDKALEANPALKDKILDELTDES